MKNKIKNYVDDLFSDIYETRQLQELKEEVSANMLEKINDFIAGGDSGDEAFNKAVASLGNMSELVDSLKKASEEKMLRDIFQSQPIDKKHVIGYVTASAILLFGIMISAIIYFQYKTIQNAVAALMPFVTASTALFVYFGLTQETTTDYGMNSKRAMAYSLATALLLIGIFASGFIYFSGNALYEVVGTLMPFIIPSTVIFIYLGLTEKSRRKMDSTWQEQWIKYYSNPKSMALRGNLSGALWIFTIAAIFLVGFTLGWKFSWVVFIVAIGCEVLIEAYFTGKKAS